MNKMSHPRDYLNAQQTALRMALEAPEQHPQAMVLLQTQHARLHTAGVAMNPGWSYEDDLFTGLSDSHLRLVPLGADHSISWLIWHIARCEDITMNILVAGFPQILHQQGWFKLMGVDACDTGNAMNPAQIAELSARIDILALRAYRQAVGRQTQQIIDQLQLSDLRRRIDPERINQVIAQGAVVEAAYGVLDYWSKRTVAGLMLMPATRHPLIHLNEAWRIKQKLH